MVGFEGIVGVTGLSQSVVESIGGAWNSNLKTCPLSGKNAKPTLKTSCLPTSNIADNYDCACKAVLFDGFPICFSYPVLPSSINRDFFRYTRSDSKVFSPRCISSRPNNEHNERHCVVIFDDFINRGTQNQPGRIFMKKIEIIGDLILVGPNGKLVSMKGKERVAPEAETPFQIGPYFLAARLQRLTNLGEGTSFPGTRPANDNSGVLYSPQCNAINNFMYRLRLFYSAGMTPDGVTGLKPTQYA